MLVNKQSSYNSGDIVSFKLANGDEVIAEVVEVTDTGWIVKRPFVVVPSQQGIGLMQALFTGNIERGMELNRSSVYYMQIPSPKCTVIISRPPQA